MQDLSCPSILTAAAVTLARALPGAAVAYGEDNAIRDCEKRLRDEYKLSDFRHESAEKIPGEGHKFKVKGETKMDGKKYPFECAIADCHVTSITYNGPEPEGLGTSEKLAIGAAAAIPAGVIASKLSESDESSESRGMPAVDTAAAKTLLSAGRELADPGLPAQGTKTLSGTIKGYQTSAYVLPVKKGRRIARPARWSRGPSSPPSTARRSKPT